MRLQVYRTCVISTLYYAIFAAGFGKVEAWQIHRLVMKHLRYIALSHRLLTKDSNEDLRQRLRCNLPLADLQRVWESKCRAWTRHWHQFKTEDIGKLTPCYPDMPSLLTPTAAPGRADDEDVESTWKCRFCDKTFATWKARSTPETRVHKPSADSIRQQALPFDAGRDAVPGTWQCAHCHMTFGRCLNLSRHISLGACRQFDPNRKPSSIPYVAREDIRTIIKGQGIEALCGDAEVCKALTQECALCGRKFEHAWRISQHLQRCNAPVYKQSQKEWGCLKSRCKGSHTAASCTYCGANVQTLAQRNCPVLCQIACVQTVVNSHPTAPQVERDAEALPQADPELDASRPLNQVGEGRFKANECSWSSCPPGSPQQPAGTTREPGRRLLQRQPAETVVSKAEVPGKPAMARSRTIKQFFQMPKSGEGQDPHETMDTDDMPNIDKCAACHRMQDSATPDWIHVTDTGCQGSGAGKPKRRRVDETPSHDASARVGPESHGADARHASSTTLHANIWGLDGGQERRASTSQRTDQEPQTNSATGTGTEDQDGRWLGLPAASCPGQAGPLPRGRTHGQSTGSKADDVPAVGEKCMIPTLVNISKTWHQREDKANVKERLPLRMVMITGLLRQLELRLQKTMSEASEGQMTQAELVKNRLLTADGRRWNQMQWCKETSQLVPVEGQTMSLSEALALLQEAQSLVQMPGTILRFHALKALQKVEAKDGNVVGPWRLVIGMRTPAADKLYGLMRQLCHSALLQVILARMRPATMQRSPLAQRIGHMMST